MLNILDRLDCLIVRNRSFEAKRLVQQELNNIRKITEKNCKRLRLNKTYCRVCTNLNCNNNQNKVTQKEVKNERIKNA